MVFINGKKKFQDYDYKQDKNGYTVLGFDYKQDINDQKVLDDVITGQNLGSFRMMYTNRTKMDGNFLSNVFNRTKISLR